MVQFKNLQVHLCPPTSFYIDPDPTDFRRDVQQPGYLRLAWREDGTFSAAPTYVDGQF